MRSIGLEGQVAELVDDQQLRLGVVGQPLIKPAFPVRLRKLCHQRRGRSEQHGIPGYDGFPAECDRQVRLADARRSEEENRLTVSDKPPGGDLPDLCLVQRRLSPVVEAREVADEGKARETKAHVDPPLIPAGDLTLTEQRQCLSDRQVPPSRLVDQAVELIAEHGQLQAVQQCGEVIMGVHQNDPPQPLRTLPADAAAPRWLGAGLAERR